MREVGVVIVKTICFIEPNAKVTPLICKDFLSSNHIYSAVVYWKIKTAVRDRVRYISGKKKVVPLEFVSVLHLELLGCVLQNKFINEVCSAVTSRLLIHNKFCWADSEVALFWIMGNEKSWKSCVENRVLKVSKGWR